jgi:glutamate dehydrogenase
VEEVIRRIELNARSEFQCLWKEHEATGLPLTLLSNRLSIAINSLTSELANSELYANETLRHHVLSEALPDLLLEKVGLKVLLDRIPDPYLLAMFSSHLASNFVYEFGINTSPMTFYTFMNTLQNKIKN